MRARLLCVLVAAVLLLPAGLAGCGASESTPSATQKGTVAETPAGAGTETAAPTSRGPTEPAEATDVPNPVARRLALGAAHTCTIGEDPRTVVCFGGHRFGQLGPNAPSPSGRSASHGRHLVAFTTEVASLSAGSFHTCARLRAKGRVAQSTRSSAAEETASTEADVFCWGHGGYGQLGQARDRDDHPEPLPLPTDGPVIDVAAGEMHTCVLHVDGAVRCVGRAPFGQWPVAPASREGSDAGPWHRVPLDGAATRLLSGRHHLCAQLARGPLMCWGADMDGQIATGQAVEASPSKANRPGARVSFSRPPTAMAAKAQLGLWAYGERTCAQASPTAPLACWGPGLAAQGRALSNVDGPHEASRSLAGSAASGGGVPLLGGHHLCLVRRAGLVCAGGNAFGQLGVGDTEPREAPVDVRLPEGVAASDIVASAAGYRHSCLLAQPEGALQPRLLCWGDNRLGQSCPADDAQCHGAQESVTLPLLLGTAKNSRKNGGTD